ncbi:hypothetical protein L9F63_018484 [Diploptera punctata]|uniref:DUF4485 domain-containing protein n=1 Tax=Diploptera punctata TaxID=6984 RepID=A0AAD7ZWT6_DIPPU|nr:hypothetical protein L9F63_018484 [Diploptera punctata]
MESAEGKPMAKEATSSLKSSTGSKTSRLSKSSQGSMRFLEPTTRSREKTESETESEGLRKQAELERKNKPQSFQEPSKTSSTATSGNVTSKISCLSRRDPLITEFIYYSAMLKLLGTALTSEANRCRVIPWIRKLFGPEYQVEMFRTKRNKYLCSLTITLLNDEVSGVFNNPPPPGALYEVKIWRARCSKKRSGRKMTPGSKYVKICQILSSNQIALSMATGNAEKKTIGVTRC